MSRLAWILTVLVLLLVGVLWWFLLWSPTSEEIEETRTQTEGVLAQAQSQRQRAAQLRQVRESAPEAEAQLAEARALVPTDPQIPAVLRQLQSAADESGVRLSSIAPSAPAQGEVNGVPVNTVGVSMAVEGTYFQIIDFTRRIEDPAITARALQWSSISIGPAEYPTLSVSLSGQIYARGEFVPAPPEPAPTEDPDGADDGVDGTDEGEEVDNLDTEDGELEEASS